ncbi:Cell division cycle protein 27 like protein [Cyphomyrmex costatus]|uniref:Cell division cycle protein 27 homolog n=1 Tax=Cyphomyrmex costatus TaxID=456900 RepID=A0A151IHT1_9HYME|nr:Cell division cycle protein 27 like protein [Cyphomyrmex costatus]
MIVQEPVQVMEENKSDGGGEGGAAIWHCLNHYAYPDAIFLAERLCAEVDTEESLFLLATCYYRSGRVRQAYALLSQKAPSSAQCRFLLAKCCYDLEKYAEAEAAIIGGYYKQLKNLEEIITQFGEQACFSLQIIAKIYYKMMRTARGNEAHKLALKLNPFLWHSFEELCNVGEKVDPSKVFQLDKLDSFAMCHGTVSTISYVTEPDLIVPGNNANNTPISNGTNSTPVTIASTLINGGQAPQVRLCSSIEESPQNMSIHYSNCSSISPRTKLSRYRSMFSNSMSPLTPSFGILPLENNTPEQTVPPSHTTLTEANDQKSLAKRVSSLRAHVGQLMSRKETPLQQGKSVFSQSGNTSNTANIVTVTAANPTSPPSPTFQGTNVRRSSRLFSHNSVKENNKSPNRNKFATPKSPSRKTKARLAKANLNKTNFNELNERNRNEKEKSETITSEKAVANANALNAQNNNIHSGITLQKQSAEGLMSLLRELGMAYQHLSQFKCTHAAHILSILPSRHYNTGWVLSMLARAHFEMMDYKKAARDGALLFEPQRTELMEIYSTVLWHLHAEVQLSTLAQDLVSQDRNSAAAWCATGNLFSAQTEHETAIKFFQRAIQVDPNFPYAYTLLGHEYVLTEELDKAITAFRVVQHALKKTDQALKTLNTALMNDPDNTLCKFHRASINFSIGRHMEALREFEELKNIIPKESLVYYSIGKVHKKLGNTHLALMYFSWATDLDPKGVNSQIKEAILSPGQGDDDSPPTQSDEQQAQSNSMEQDVETSREGSAAPLAGNVSVEPHADDSDDSL